MYTHTPPTHTLSLSHTHTHTLQSHALLVMGLVDNGKEWTNQSVERNRWLQLYWQDLGHDNLSIYTSNHRAFHQSTHSLLVRNYELAGLKAGPLMFCHVLMCYLSDEPSMFYRSLMCYLSCKASMFYQGLVSCPMNSPCFSTGPPLWYLSYEPSLFYQGVIFVLWTVHVLVPGL